MRHDGREMLSAGPALTGRLRQEGLFHRDDENIASDKFA
jgi:hypothetical protein